MRAQSAVASLTEIPAGRLAFTQMEPSLSSGRNSVPNRGTSARLRASAATDAASTVRGRVKAHASAG